MKNKKGLIFVLIILMSVGFAAVTTTLIINGTTIVAENEEDYQVYFSGAVVDKEDYTNEIISKDKKTITFETILKSKDEISTLEYEVTNASTIYDASVKVTVKVDNTNEIEVTNTFDAEKKLSARETRKGTLEIKLKKVTLEEKRIPITVKLEFNAEERDTIDKTPITSKVYSISGYFTDKEGNVIPNANVAVFSESPQFVKTDDYGYFYVGNLERGKHELYYIDSLDVNKDKETIQQNAIDTVNVTTTHTGEIEFNEGHKIIKNKLKEENNKKIKIILVKNNGEADEEIEVTENTRYEDLPIPTKEGIKFLYWKDEKGKIITDNTFIIETTTNKLYAYYGENTYTIAYNLKEGSAEKAPTGAMFDKDVEITNPTKQATITIDANNQGATLTKNTYTGNPVFTGWTGENLSSSALANGTSWNGSLTKATTFKNLTSELNGTVTLTANYEETNITLDTPTKTGYTCGYTDTPTGEIKYTTSISTSDNKTIYVKCNPNTYTINFDTDGGTTVNSKTVTYDSKIGEITNPTKTGYNFGGWYLDTESITSESVYKYAKDITLKAKWTEGTNTKYTVNYYLQTIDKTYGEVTESIVYTGTTNKTVDAALKTYEGFVTPSKQTVKILSDGSAKVDYYYERKELKVTFINGSTRKEVKYLYGKENQAFTNNGFNKTGYTLTGYSEKENGSKNYEVTNTVSGEFIDTNYPSKTLYAVFTANTYKVVFNNNGGTGTKTELTCTYNKDCKLSTEGFTKEGYTISGWSKTSEGEIEYTADATVRNLVESGSITLYAKWSANTYTITYNANGGTGSMNKTTCVYDTNCTIAGNSFKKENYDFVNWAKDSVTGETYNAGATVKNLVTSGNVDMYAIWEESLSQFGKDDWQTIAANVKSGDTDKYNVGDTKEVDLGSLGTHKLRIANKSECTNGETSETACGFVVEFADIITKQKFNSTNTNKGGWKDSELRTYINDTIYKSLPSDLQNVITSTKVISSHGSTRGETNFETQDKLYLLSSEEIWKDFASSSNAQYDTSTGTSKQLDYYKSQGVTTDNYAGAIKQYNGSNYNWWLRSASSTDLVRFIRVLSGGEWNYYTAAGDSFGATPAFRLQGPTAFQKDDWETIAANVKSGNTDKYNIGDTKDVDLGTFGTHTVRIANKSECTTETSETACGFVVEFADVITEQPFNSTNKSKGGWRDSELRTYINDTIYKSLPSDLQNVITSTKVISSHGKNSGETNFETQDKLYLLSSEEIWEDFSSSSNAQYDTAVGTSRQLDYYKKQGVTTASYAGAKKQYNGSNKYWWLRSAASDSVACFLIVGAYDEWGDTNTGSGYSRGVSPAFRLQGPGPVSFSEDSWQTIQKAVKSGNTDLYKIGDTKEVDLGTLGTHTVRIANKSECTTETSETACGFVVEFADIITKQKFNSTNTNKGGWRDSKIRTYVNGTIYNVLPNDLQNVIATTKVISSHGSTSGETNFETQDKLYLLSCEEIYGDFASSTSAEYDTALGTSKQLDYYKNQGVTKTNYSGSIKQYNGSNSYWWLLSAPSFDAINFRRVDYNGGWTASAAGDSYGVSPAFRIA